MQNSHFEIVLYYSCQALEQAEKVAGQLREAGQTVYLDAPERLPKADGAIVLQGAFGELDWQHPALQAALERANRDRTFHRFAGNRAFRLLVAHLPGAPSDNVPPEFAVFPQIDLREGINASPLLAAFQNYTAIETTETLPPELEAEPETEAVALHSDPNSEAVQVALPKTRLGKRFGVAFGLIGLVGLILIGLSLWFRQTTEQQTIHYNVLRSWELAAQANNQLRYDPELALRLAIEATQIAPTEQAESVLRQAVRLPFPRAVIGAKSGSYKDFYFSADSRYLLTATRNLNQNGNLQLWDISTATLIKDLSDLKTSPSSASFSPDGKYLLIAPGYINSNVDLIEIATGKKLDSLVTAKNYVNYAAFSPDGQFIITQEYGNKVHLYKRDNLKQEITSFQTNNNNNSLNYASNLVFSPDSQFIAVAQDDIIKIIKAADGSLVNYFENTNGNVLALAFSHAGTRLAVGTNDGSINMLEFPSGRKITSLTGHAGWVRTLGFSPDDKLLFSTADDRSVRAWDLSNESSPKMISFGNGIASANFFGVDKLAWTPDGGYFLTIADNGAARLWSQPLREAMELRGSNNSSVVLAAFTPDGKTVVTSNSDGTVRLWDLPPLNLPIQKSIFNGTRTTLAFSPDGSRMVHYFGSDVKIFNSKDGELVSSFMADETMVRAVTFNSDSTRLVTGGSDNARVWDTANGRLIATLQPHTGSVTKIAYSPDGKWIATADSDKKVQLWKADTGEFVTKFSDNQAQVLEFSPDSRYLIIGSGQTVRVIEVAKNYPLFTITHPSAVKQAKISPDGNLLVVIGADAVAKVWQVQNEGVTVKSLSALTGHEGELTSVSFSPNSKLILTTAKDNTARLWNTYSGTNLVTMPLTYVGEATGIAKFSPDGKLVLLSSFITSLWDVSSGQQLYTVKTPYYNDIVISSDIGIAFSANAKRIYAVNQNGVLSISNCTICSSSEELLILARARHPRDLTPPEKATFLGTP